MNNLFKHDHVVTKIDRQILLNQKSPVIWLTGLSGSGKSTIANELSKQLTQLGKLCYILDGDNVRMGLNKDLGFSDDDRKENIRRIAEVAKLMSDAGVITITAFISPFREERDAAKQIIGEDDFFEIFVNSSLELCESRDPKGLYKKARSGEIKMFTGIDSPYESPITPYMEVMTENNSPSDCTNEIIKKLNSTNILFESPKEINNLDKQKTLAIDFDGVIHKYSKGFKGLDNIYDEPMENLTESLVKLINDGFDLKILSSRPKQYIIEWLEKHNLNTYFSEVSNHKFPATLYIDDRGFHFTNWEKLIDDIYSHPKIKK